MNKVHYRLLLGLYIIYKKKDGVLGGGKKHKLSV
jgi:hypothetical protein